MGIPDGWTDDMTIPLPAGVTVDRIVDFVLSSSASGLPAEKRIAELVAWGLPQDDAELAADRALGGAFRAGTTHPGNAPSKDKDPIASASYERCRKEPALIAIIFPEHFSPAASVCFNKPRPWWKFWR